MLSYLIPCKITKHDLFNSLCLHSTNALIMTKEEEVKYFYRLILKHQLDNNGVFLKQKI
jgi:Zn-dependent M16 (insulinase) family peptidase